MGQGDFVQEELQAGERQLRNSLDEERECLEVAALLEKTSAAFAARARKAAINAKMARTFLEIFGVDAAAIAEDQAKAYESRLPTELTEEAVLRFLLPEKTRRKRVTGDALLDLFAREIVKSDKPMTISGMLEYLDTHGYERPGENARNNIIGMVVRAKDRFKRVERGTYSVTDEERQRQIAALNQERGFDF